MLASLRSMKKIIGSGSGPHLSEAWIRGSWSAPKCHGSATLLKSFISCVRYLVLSLSSWSRSICLYTFFHLFFQKYLITLTQQTLFMMPQLSSCSWFLIFLPKFLLINDGDPWHQLPTPNIHGNLYLATTQKYFVFSRFLGRKVPHPSLPCSPAPGSRRPSQGQQTLRRPHNHRTQGGILLHCNNNEERRLLIKTIIFIEKSYFLRSPSPP